MTATKSFALAEVKSVDDESKFGSFEAILSAPNTDRDNEIVQKGAFGDLPPHITIDTDHGLTMATTIGSGTPYYDGDLLKIKGTFSSIPRAQEARALVTEGHITTMSVAFLPKEKLRGKAAGDPTIITKAELLNAAFVSVPANRDALVLSAKALDRTAPTTKAVVGSHEERQEVLREALVAANTDAIRAAYPDAQPGEFMWHLHIVATFDDRVVYRIGWADDDALQVTYTWDGDTATITGTPVAVTIDQVVSPAEPEDAAAKAAATPPVDADEDEMHMRARALSLAATAATS